MKLKKFLVLGFCLQTLTNVSDSFASYNAAEHLIEEAVDNAISEVLPKGSSWKIKTPPGLEQRIKNPNSVEVLFPSGLKSDRMVAQVKVKDSNEEILIAIPITINSLGSSELRIANNQAITFDN